MCENSDVICISFFFFETSSHCVALTVLLPLPPKCCCSMTNGSLLILHLYMWPVDFLWNKNMFSIFIASYPKLYSEVYCCITITRLSLTFLSLMILRSLKFAQKCSHIYWCFFGVNFYLFWCLFSLSFFPQISGDLW
jgi:hypothetical protein